MSTSFAHCSTAKNVHGTPRDESLITFGCPRPDLGRRRGRSLLRARSCWRIVDTTGTALFAKQGFSKGRVRIDCAAGLRSWNVKCDTRLGCRRRPHAVAGAMRTPARMSPAAIRSPYPSIIRGEIARSPDNGDEPTRQLGDPVRLTPPHRTRRNQRLADADGQGSRQHEFGCRLLIDAT